MVHSYSLKIKKTTKALSEGKPKLTHQKIRLLDEAVINRIAAGEVVERPASVVKELLDNSIDAGATQVRVDIEKGGSGLIRVKDNGHGMSRDDCLLSIERHTTSKLRSEVELVRIATMGFRGEALASIASVSRLSLLSYDGVTDGGTRVDVEGGSIRNVEPVGMGRGTVVEVRNLFFNVPVRRKFLKGHKVEAGHIEEITGKIALAYPSVGFVYSEDGRVKMDSPASGSTYERLRSLYSKDVCDNLVSVDYCLEDIALHGFVAKPPYTRSDTRSIVFFVNARPVRDRLINAAMNRAFANLLERGRYPLAILFLDIPPDKVDVNVHPQKTEVRFTQPQKVFDAILQGVQGAVMPAPPHIGGAYREPIFPVSPVSSMARHMSEKDPVGAGQADRNNQGAGLPARHGPQAARADRHSPGADLPAYHGPKVEPAQDIQAEVFPDVPGKFQSLGIVGCLPGSFVILHDKDDLVILDHHAAHERILFEDLRRADTKAAVVQSQELLIPKVLEFSGLEARALVAAMDVLVRIGFHIEEFGERSFVVRAVPVWLGSTDPGELFNEIVAGMLEEGIKGDPEARRDQLLKNVACKAAAKESKKLHVTEIASLLRDLDRVGSIEVCPHGRPILVRYSFKEIRRKLGRT